MSQRWAWLLLAVLWALAIAIWLRHWSAWPETVSAYPLPHHDGVSAVPATQRPVQGAFQAY